MNNNSQNLRRDFLNKSMKLAAVAGAFGIFGNAKNLFSKDIKKEADMKIPQITLNNGVNMPAIGYGTWDVRGDDGQAAMEEAFRAGYRLIDTASYYKNEDRLGAAIATSGLKREEIFITTKMWEDGDEKATINAFETSRKLLGLEQIDLYLLHWPRSNDIARYKGLEQLYAKKKVRAIGVSNFGVRELEELFAKTSIIPAINQILLHPFHIDNELINLCREKNIAIEAYTPLGNIKRASQNKTLKAIAKKHNKTIAQVMLRWSVQSGFIPIPKSSNPTRMRQNLDIFDFALEAKDMQEIAKLGSSAS